MKLLNVLIGFQMVVGLDGASYQVRSDKSNCRPIENMGWWSEGHEVVECEEKLNMCVCDIKCAGDFVSEETGNQNSWKLICLGMSNLENAAWFRPSWDKGKSNKCIKK